MTTRRDFVIAAAVALVPFASSAQQEPKVRRIGFIHGASPAYPMTLQMDAFRAGLRDFGYVEGKNLVIEYRWAEGKSERIPGMVADLVRLNVDLIVTAGTSALVEAKRAGYTIPIVTAATSDLVELGLIASLAKPGGNITGNTTLNPELAAKAVELLKEVVPKLTRLAVLLSNLPDKSPNIKMRMDAITGVAKRLKVAISMFAVHNSKEIEDAFAAMAKQRAGAVLMPSSPLLNVHAKSVIDLALKYRLPSSSNVEFVEAGGMMGYSLDFPAMYRQTAVFIDKIFKGAKPGDLPMARPTKFELAINMKTANALGIRIPQSVLLRATKVIE